MAGEETFVNKCGWAGCSEAPLLNGALCAGHACGLIEAPLRDFRAFLEMLPFTMRVTVAGSALYHTVHTAVHLGLFTPLLGHDLIRAATASRNGDGVENTVEKLLASVRPNDQGEFMMHLKRQLLVPERRAARREPR
ncbi:MAG: hypothetical protein JO258_04415 [Alphaproteobacteria bacterium]|nr:hypothetical protein [Alphaproteobacteria bacterium]